MRLPPLPTLASPRVRALLIGLLLGSTILSACTEAPAADPSSPANRAGTLTIVPSLAFKGAGRMSAAQSDALNQAFNRVDHFRLVIRRSSNNEVVKDTVISVTPGQDSYDLSSPVPEVLPNEQFLVVITALQGEVVLFQSDPVAVQAVPQGANPSPASSPKIELDYAGPGADAASVSVAPGSLVLAPGGSGALTATVRNTAGATVSNVPVSWSASGGVATVSATGQVTGASEGANQVTATTPTGLTATTWVYVVSGDLAFVQGGHVRVRAAAGGSASDLTPGASSASNPTFSSGGTLAYVDGGSVYVGGTRVTTGAWPSISPDASKLAVERSGTVWFTNIDGSNATQGPGGSSPVWIPDGQNLAVAGGSIDRVRADGTGRSTMVGGAATLPALGAGGALAYVSGGAAQIQGRGSVQSGATGRPAWSPSARWLVVPTGSDLMLVDAVGTAPAVALGLSGGSDPVWRGAAFSGPTTAPAIGSLDPANPVPGSALALVGRGFDWIIPANNRVFFPSAAGPVQGQVTAVTDTRLTTVMPLGTTAGSIRLVTTAGESSAAFTPRLGSIHVRAHLTGDVPAPGQHIIVRRGATIDVAAEANTDAQGAASFDLDPGDYSVQIQPSTGYQVFGGNTVAVHLDFAVADVAFDMGVLPVRVTLDPASPLSLEVGTIVSVRAHALDVNGNELTTFRSIRWNGSSRVQVGGTLDAKVAGVAASAQAGDATFQLQLDGIGFDFSATVTSFVAGTVTQIPDGGGAATPVSNVSVQVRDGSGHATNTTTNDAGAYKLSGLMGGTYTLSVNAPSGYAAAPITRSVTLGPGASGQDFQLARFFVQGTVTESGSPSSGVTMQIFPSGSSTAYATVTTGSDGKYKFAPVPAGTYDVQAAPSGGKVANPASRSVTLDASHTSVSGQDFTVVGTSIEGTITESGSPSTGVTVQLFTSGLSTVLATTTTNGSGLYHFGDVGAGSFDVKPTAPNGKTVNPTSRTVTLNGSNPNPSAQNFTLSNSGGGVGGVRANIMVCGGSQRPVSNFTPSGYTLPVVDGCAPDSTTQALFVTRGAYYSIAGSAAALQAYVNAGGIIITEYNISNIVWNEVFGTFANLGALNGSCYDVVPSVVQFNTSDPFWSNNSFRAVPSNMTGCGYAVNNYPGITTLLGWNASNAALGYRDLGSGRVWAVEWDWQDLEDAYLDNQFDHVGDLAYMNQLMGYMILHRGVGGAIRAGLRAPLPTPVTAIGQNPAGASDTRAIVPAAVRAPRESADAERNRR